MNIKKRTILALSAVLAASSLLSSCNNEAKVEQAQTEVAEEQTPVVEEVMVVEETTPAPVEVVEEEIIVVEEVAATEKKAETPAKKTTVAEVTKAEKKVAETKETAAGVPDMKFEHTEFEFGEIMQNDKVEHTFNFKNTGTAPLLITNARASCGCTVPEWPKEPIAPGKSGKIDVVFNSRGKSGSQNKAVTITTNIVDQPQQVVYLKGNVKVPETPAAE